VKLTISTSQITRINYCNQESLIDNQSYGSTTKDDENRQKSHIENSHSIASTNLMIYNMHMLIYIYTVWEILKHSNGSKISYIYGM